MKSIKNIKNMGNMEKKEINLKKKGIVFAAIVVSCGFVFSQNIELPEVTTVIEGENILVEDEALPPFKNVIIIPQKSSGQGLVLPEITVMQSENSGNLQKKLAEKDIFAEGKIGGGFPTLFTGEFSVFRTTTNSPFKIYFLYDSALGYANKSLSDGFSDQTVNLTVDKSYSKNGFNWDLKGGYVSLSNGLQNQNESITKTNQNEYLGNVDFSYDFKNNVKLGANLGIDFYNRYADSLSPDILSPAVFGFEPSVYALWSGHGFKTELSGSYLFENDFQNVIVGDATNRGELAANISWSNDIFKVFAKFGGVFSNSLNQNNAIAPFSLGGETSFPVYFSLRKVSISAEGGLESNANRISELEEKYRFSSINMMPSESANWYGKVSFKVPLKESFTGIASFEYRKSAFGNGKWQPVYEDDFMADGLYLYKNCDLQQFVSDINFAWNYKIFSVAGGWHSNWIDVPALENMHKVYLNLTVQSEDSKWGADLKYIQPLENSFIEPFINLEGFVRLTSAVRAVFSVQDAVKLFQGAPRLCCGKYYDRGGSATAMLKFFF